MAKKTETKKNTESFKSIEGALAAGKVCTIDPKAQIDIKVIGEFRNYIGETLNYLFTTQDEKETIKVLAHVKEGFKQVPKDAPYDGYMNSVWTLMSLMSEINHQAAQQGKIIITDEDHDESLSKIIKDVDNDKGKEILEQSLRKNRNAYKDNITNTNKEKSNEG
tara:strand:- start:988 stop:1479 length:492 start_codon:yes stop_codon:yes gene_type:complete